MPIIKHEGQTQIEFGTGDINVSPGLLQLDYPCGVVVFQPKDPGPIGERKKNTTIVALPAETPVRMTFDKVESIDVVIRALQETKRMMEEETWESLLAPKEGAEQ
ncbi:hypothetical protein QP794_01750 [Paenibacillus sp. UMB7766-LJ446]|uniref:hypothetical protein n=1 Tax=Paenibacillus sp. UMB7766-LJ446 TaxID=3046313 RepID=UPI00254EF252|nr:hypothetical protein [Paenibacillus sp. UMB7766-LJ446]MDK8188806.1 hypothetical protein [Paenibacillus sp. UMB7766-LJ446]